MQVRPLFLRAILACLSSPELLLIGAGPGTWACDGVCALDVAVLWRMSVVLRSVELYHLVSYPVAGAAFHRSSKLDRKKRFHLTFAFVCSRRRLRSC
jgi:hypothetical protein